MGGFKNEKNNVLFENGSIKLIIAHLVCCSRKMKEACVNAGEMLDNHEDKITNRLVENHLNINSLFFHFEPQTQEKFNTKTGLFEGRCDIKVFSMDIFREPKAYFLIESKRIDGSTHLNNEYVKNGVSRFVINSPKYSSYYKQSIMFAYVVQAIDISENAEKIEAIQKAFLIGVDIGDFSVLQTNSDFAEYSCDYSSSAIEKIELRHLFFDFSDVVNKS